MSERHPEMRLDRDETEALLVRHGIMPTQQRMEIASILFAERQHISAEVLMERANDGEVLVSKATIYNTLRLFAARGLIKEVKVDPSKIYYDSNPAPHHHFYDTTTGELTDIGPEEIEISRLPGPPAGTTLEVIEVIIKVNHNS